MKIKYTRKDLIQLCIDAVVPHYKWHDRDSYAAQLSIQSIYEGLTGGVKYSYTITNNTIWITFNKPIKDQLKKSQHLNIDSRDDYFNWFLKEYGDNLEPEMFDSIGIDWNSNYLTSYMPTRERLNNCNNDDWY